MNFEKRLTNKKHYPALLIEGGEVVVQHLNGQYSVHQSDTGTYLPTDVTQLEFDAKPFLAAYEKHVATHEAARAAKEAAAKEIEDRRINDLREAITGCVCPQDLIDRFDLKCVETADHWNELYNGKSRQAIAIADRAEKEIIDLAIEVHNWEGNFGELKHRGGERHHVFFRDNSLRELSDYQELCEKHFSGTDYFYKSKESEEEFVLEQIQEAESIDAVKVLLANYEDLEAGYYSCGGSLIISDADLNSPDFTGYYYDVYTYNYAFGFKTDSRWTEEVQEHEDSESEG